jgi:outer membrane immunogenic protein
MFYKSVLAAAAAITISSSVFAADLPSRKSPPVYIPPPPVFTWTGAYIGVQLGANIVRDSVGIPLYPSYFSINDTSVSAGGKIGYNYQVQQFVFGIEGAAAAVFNSGSLASGGGGGELYQTHQNFTGDIVGKVGYAADRALFYAKGGAAFANLNNMRFVEFVPTPPIPVVSQFRVGWTVGGGIDYAITNNLIVGVDYAYSDLGTGHYFYLGPVNVHHTENAINASLSYKFDTFAPPIPVVAKY